VLRRTLPRKYDYKKIETDWQNKWELWNIYRFNKEDRSQPTYVIDTPPPYPSGEFHTGNALNWCYIDAVARYMRMRGYNVYFPQGWDCHGLPTEVRAEKTYNVHKSSMPYNEFLRICMELTDKWIKQMKRTMKRLGFSIDWSLEYRTMDPQYWSKTQYSFIQMYKKGFVYRGEHPVLWCPRCETAIAEAEVEYVNRNTKLYYIKFEKEEKDGFKTIATTRPELLPACVGILVNPNDKRYSELIGKKLIVPIFNRKVEVYADEDVDPSFGSGIVMVCTFGDKTDVKWQHKFRLPIIKVIDETGRMTREAEEFVGLTIKECKEKIVSKLKKMNKIVKEEDLTQSIGTCWRCHTPVEILVKNQWFVKTRSLTQDILKWADKIKWVPKWAKNRLIDWVNSLDWDWVISRQRIFATPIPIWYCKSCGEIIVAKEEWLPVDPRSEIPRINKCPRCGGTEFIGESDVMDTWMDSSITCAVHAGWPYDLESFKRLFPADLQPNGYDIIRTWDYYLIVRGLILFGKPQFKIGLINGMVRGTDGRMMHKSYGNYVEAVEVIDKYGADSLRQWAFSGGTTGSDVSFRWEDIEYGWRFLLKLWNAARFVSIHIENYVYEENVNLTLIDRWILFKLRNLIVQVTEEMDGFQFNMALDNIRRFFWHIFCDQYIEAAKHRLYGDDEESKKAAKYTLYKVLYISLQLLAPFIPHMVEEIYQKLYTEDKGFSSIHVSPWPKVEINGISEEEEQEGNLIIAIISELRRRKSANRVPLSASINEAIINVPKNLKRVISKNEEIISKVIKAKKITIKVDEEEKAVKLKDYPGISVNIKK